MKIQKSQIMLIALLFLTLACGQSAPATPTPPPQDRSGFNWDLYQPRTLAEVVSLANENVNLEEFKGSAVNSVYLEMGSEYTYPSQVRVVYGGKFRETPPYRLFIIGQWIRPLDPSTTEEQVNALFAQEVRFTEGSTTYWIPVQASLAQEMRNELQAGEEVILCVRWIALANMSDGLDYIFIVNAWKHIWAKE